MIREYYRLTKPGIIYGNLLTAAAGFLFAARWHIDFGLLVATLAGTSLVIASACVFNNYIDRGIDKNMARTKKRALVEGRISGSQALTFASTLGIVGFLVLGLWVNALVVAIGIVAFIDYIVFYGISKRRSVYGTLVGSISGAAPIVAGYCAVTDHWDSAATTLFLILVFWQMAHFYAIATYRFDDYKAAGLPVLPVKNGVQTAKAQIVLYILAFTLATSSLTILGYTGTIFLVAMTVVALVWLWMGLQGFTIKAKDDKAWARKMFLFSLIVILALSVMLSIGAVIA